MNNVEKIHAKIMSLPIPEEVMKNIHEQLAGQKMEGLYAVRSSGVFEDTAHSSGAGVYETILNVTADGLEDAILQCWASLFGETSLLHVKDPNITIDDFKMGIIIQEMVKADKSGILFTNNPINNNSGQLLIETSHGLGDQVVSGVKDVTTYTYDRIKEQSILTQGEEVLAPTEIRQLVSKALQLEEIFQSPQDIEWAFAGEQLWILQSRPITTIEEKKIDRVRIFSFHELNDDLKEYLGDLQFRYEHWTLKKIPFYRGCNEAHIPSCGWHFINYTNRLLTDQILEELMSKLVAPYQYLSINETVMDLQIPTEELPQKLKELGDLFNNQPITIGICDSFPTEVAILTNITNDGNVFIEYVPGTMKGLLSGYMTPSSLLVDRTGEVLEKNLVEHDFYYKFDLERVDIVRTEEKIQVELSPHEIQELVENTFRIDQVMAGEVIVEWWKWNGTIWANDTSLVDHHQLPLAQKDQEYSIISPGEIAGTVIKVDDFDLDEITYLSHGRGLSVIKSRGSIDFDFSYLRNLKEKILQLKEKGERVIIFLPKPYLYFVPLCEIVDGFIFETASLLCHFSIILREKNIPAISLDGKELSGEFGKNISIVAGSSFCNRGSSENKFY